MFVSESSRKESAMTSKHHATQHKRGRGLYMWRCFKKASTSLVGSLKIDAKSVMDRVVKHRADCTDAKAGREGSHLRTSFQEGCWIVVVGQRS